MRNMFATRSRGLNAFGNVATALFPFSLRTDQHFAELCNGSDRIGLRCIPAVVGVFDRNWATELGPSWRRRALAPLTRGPSTEVDETLPTLVR